LRLEVAAAVLGHARVVTTQRYAEINVQKALAVMQEAG
jgi:site-specific recombinase XerD